MNVTPLHSALREMRALFTNGRSWAMLGVLGLIVGLIGPFGTFEVIPLLPRLAYWIAVVLTTALAGTFIASFVEVILKPKMAFWLAALLAGAAAGPVLGLMVALFNVGIFGPHIAVIDVTVLVIYCTLISMAVTLMGALLDGTEVKDASPSVTQPVQPALLDRLPLPQRGRLIHIAVSDHYVDVTTDKGTSLVLMRLSDAIRETAPIVGLQVHRSHWVALDAVSRALRQNGKPVLELENGTLVPVSRTYQSAVKAAGLMP